jgi:hypothetical protein
VGALEKNVQYCYSQQTNISLNIMQDVAVSVSWHLTLEARVLHQSLELEFPHSVLLFGPQLETLGFVYLLKSAEIRERGEGQILKSFCSGCSDQQQARCKLLFPRI